MKKLVIVLFLLVLLLVSCAPSIPTDSSIINFENNEGVVARIGTGIYYGYVIKFYDPEDDVLCYVFVGDSKGGISCLQLDK